MKQKQETQTQEAVMAVNPLAQDVRNSVLIVSLGINLFALSLWIALQLTSYYDAALASFFFGR
jgi:hypothetical protein